MIPPTTSRLNLPYLDASQAQPEVKINEAWNLIDIAFGEILTGSDVGPGGGVTIEDGDSPHTVVLDARTIKFFGANVEAASDGSAIVTIESSASLSVENDSSPHDEVTNVSVLRVSGATITDEGGGVALLTVATAPSTQTVLSAGWNSSSGAVQTALAVAQDILIPFNCTLHEVYILTQGGTGSCTVKLWKAALSAHFPPVAGDDITGGANVAVASGTTHVDPTLSGFTTNFSQNDVIRCTLSANSVFTSVKIILRMS